MTKFVRPTVIIALATLVGASASIPAYAGGKSVAHHGTRTFDGTWSVLLQTTRGNCPAAVRAGVQIIDGRLSAEDLGYGLDGRVAPSGAVKVTVSAAGQGGGASGRLTRAGGRGRWQTWSGECAGEWTAARRD